MHIVILYQHYLRPSEPGHSRVNEYANIWANAGHKVSVITGQTSYMTGLKERKYFRRFCVTESDGPVDVYRCFVPNDSNRSFLRRAFSYFAFAFSSAMIFRRLQSPSILLCSSPPLTIGMPALVICKLSRIPLLFEVRDLWPESAVSTGVLTNKTMIRFLSWLELKCYAQADRLNVLTPAFKKNIVDRGLKESDLVHNIPCGVDTEAMRPTKGVDEGRRELGWGDRIVVLYTGAMGRANCLSQLVATAELLKDRKDVLIAIVGGGMEADAIKGRIAESKLSNIIFHGSRPKEEMPGIIASADICCAVLMKSDTFKTVYPNKVFDYMACQKPVIVAIDGIIRELLEKERAGIYVEPENPESIARGILALADHPERAQEMGRNGRSFVERDFDRDVVAKRYENLLEETVAGNNSLPPSKHTKDS